MKNLIQKYIASQDYSPHSRRAIIGDLNRFADWFEEKNGESFDVRRVSLQDVTGYKKFLKDDENKSVSTINRALNSVKKFLDFCVVQKIVLKNAAKQVKEFRRQPLAPKQLPSDIVRRILREAELRHDTRGLAIMTLFLHTGCRVSDLVSISLDDLVLKQRQGSVQFVGKGGKYRVVPLNNNCRQVLSRYLESRQVSTSKKLFIGERGPLTTKGVRDIVKKYSRIVGEDVWCHLLRHTFAHQFLQDTNNDLVSLKTILGHENIDTTARYSLRSEEQLQELSEKVSY